MVSIIVPIYNSQDYLDACISSILNQKYNNFELLLIDDGSTDKSLCICRSYDDPNIRVFSKLNSGPGDSRNYGLAHVHPDSKFVCFCDSDDTLEPDYLFKLVNSIEDCDLVICNVFDKYGDNKKCLKKIKGDEVIWKEPKRNIDFLSLLKQGIMNSSCTKLYRTEIIKNHNLKFNSLYINEDACFNFEYLDNCQLIKYIDRPLYNYWHRSSSLTCASKENIIQDYLDFHRNLLSSFENQFHKYIHQFLYPQYFGIQKSMVLNRNFEKYKVNRKELLLKQSVSCYKPTCKGDWLHYITLWFFPHLYPLLLKIL